MAKSNYKELLKSFKEGGAKKTLLDGCEDVLNTSTAAGFLASVLNDDVGSKFSKLESEGVSVKEILDLLNKTLGTSFSRGTFDTAYSKWKEAKAKEEEEKAKAQTPQTAKQSPAAQTPKVQKFVNTAAAPKGQYETVLKTQQPVTEKPKSAEDTTAVLEDALNEGKAE